MLARRDLALEHVAPPPTLSRFTGRYGIVRGVASKLLWRQLFCRGPGCGAMFYIGRSCYRGQVYCGDRCRHGKHLYLGRDYKDYLNVDLFTAKQEFDFREAFSRSIAVEVVYGIPARIASEGDLKILNSLRQQSERQRP